MLRTLFILEEGNDQEALWSVVTWTSNSVVSVTKPTRIFADTVGHFIESTDTFGQQQSIPHGSNEFIPDLHLIRESNAPANFIGRR